MKKTNIAFFGTSNKSTPILEVLHSSFNLALCVTKTNRIVGRSQEEESTAVKEWTQEKNISVFEIEKMRDSEPTLLKELVRLGIDMIIVADFSFMVPDLILKEFENRIINIHFSLLPKYRGANPVQATIINGDTKTGITFLQMVKELDAGDIVFQVPYELNGTETSGELYETLFDLAAQELPNVITKYLKGKLTPQKQDPTKAILYYSPSHPKSTYIYKEDAKINWQEKPHEIEQKIRAFNPWPIAWTTLGEMEHAEICQLKPSIKKALNIKIHKAIITKEGLLEPILVQVEGKKQTDWKSFKNGYCLR